MSDFPVYYFHSEMHGAPAITPDKGTIVAALDACLITGFGSTELFDFTVESGLATATTNAGESFEVGSIIQIDSEFNPQVNGRFRVMESDVTRVTFGIDLPDGALSGSISAKYAPAEGWEKLFSAQNKAIYRSTDPASHGFCYQVDDDVHDRYSLVRGYASMSDAVSGVDPFPPPSVSTPSIVRAMTVRVAGEKIKWDIACDSRFVMWALGFGITTSATFDYANPRGFGDLIPSDISDTWASIIACQVVTTNGGNGDGMFAITGPTPDPGIYVARNALGTVVSPRVSVGASVAPSATALSGADSGSHTSRRGAVDTVDINAIGSGDYFAISNVYIRHGDDATGVPRATVPGIYFIGHRGSRSLLNSRDMIRGTGELKDRRLLALRARSLNAAVESDGVYLMDITGPWR